MLRKRGRPTFRRTTSMTEFTLDVGSLEGPPSPVLMTGGEFDHMLSPRYLSKNYYANYHVETGGFLRSCSLCNRRLAPGRDIYMYRGDTAFCSQECREQQMKQDEIKERRVATKNGESHHPELAAATPEAETMAAA